MMQALPVFMSSALSTSRPHWTSKLIVGCLHHVNVIATLSYMLYMPQDATWAKDAPFCSPCHAPNRNALQLAKAKRPMARQQRRYALLIAVGYDLASYFWLSLARLYKDSLARIAGHLRGSRALTWA